MAQRSAFAECPNCGGRNLRASQPRTFFELVRSFFGRDQFRCRNCNTRFETGVLTISDWRYARCPKCYRTELSTWSQQYYNPPWSTRASLALGATPYRCEICRCNFASFLACKERSSWRKRRATEPPQESVTRGADDTAARSDPG